MPRQYYLPFFGLALFVVGLLLFWLDTLNAYLQLIILYIGINVILTTSLNLINGFMGEFSCGHAGFMAVGAYISSVFTVWAFTQDDIFGAPALSPGLALIGFPLSLIVGGIGAAVAGLLVAIPSFRTRGDYLAIVTISVNFIVKSAIENLEVIGGPRGFMGMRSVVKAMENGVDLPWMFIWTFLSVIITLVVIRNFVYSTMGKAVMAIREDEIAAELMSVNTRRTKVIAFMLSSFFAGIAGGLFAHVLGYINPGTFTIIKSTEVMVQVYLGGMGSITGSVLSATAFTIMLEVLRPLQVWKWVVIPLLLILLMLFRREGIMGGRELSDIFPQWFGAKETHEYAPTGN